MTARVADLVQAIEAVAPSRWAADWDNAGLLVGDPSTPLSRALLAIDCTREVLDEARRLGCEAIVSYHPPLFAPQKRFVAPSVAYEAARAGMAIYSPHTAFDAAPGGTNDVLGDLLELSERRPLRPLAPGVADAGVKLVTFVPPEHVDAVSQALFSAGAGRIGNYSSCSFRSPGTGTFLGEEGARPVVGQAGRLEQAPELRLETVVPLGSVAEAVRALRRAHPYEEPAFDLVRLAPAPGDLGFGRVGEIAPASGRSVVARLKAALGVAHVLFVGSLDRTVRRVALCVGSGGDLVGDAVAASADLFVTGELRHHDALRAAAAGMAAVCTLHSTSERIALGALEKSLAARLAGVTLLRSSADHEPFAFA